MEQEISNPFTEIRQKRVKSLIANLKAKSNGKTIPLGRFVGEMQLTFGISKQTMNDYLRTLQLAKIITLDWNTDTICYIGE